MAFSILKHKRSILTITFTLGFILYNYAQPGGPGGAPGGGAVVVGGVGGGGGGAGGATGAPIDSGAIGLLIIGSYMLLERKYNFIEKVKRYKIFS